MDTTGQEPEIADENNALVGTTEVDSEVEAVEGAESAAAAAEPGKSGKPAHSAELQERFDKLTREKYEGLSRAERAEYRAQMLEQQLEQFKATAKPEPVAPADDFPTLESVNFDESKFHAAVASYYRKQAADSVKAELAQERETASRAESEKAWDARQAKFIEAKPDYAEKVMRPPSMGGPVITDAMADVIRASDIGPDVAYYLAENAAKSAEIARLPAHLQAREIGRIEARLEAAKSAPAPAVSKAPPPPAKVETASAPTSVSTLSPDSDKLSDDEWVKAEQRRMARKAQRK